MDIFWIVLVSTSLLVFCVYKTFKVAYNKGYKDGGLMVTKAWRRHVQEERDNE